MIALVFAEALAPAILGAGLGWPGRADFRTHTQAPGPAFPARTLFVVCRHCPGTSLAAILLAFLSAILPALEAEAAGRGRYSGGAHMIVPARLLSPPSGSTSPASRQRVWPALVVVVGVACVVGDPALHAVHDGRPAVRLGSGPAAPTAPSSCPPTRGRKATGRSAALKLQSSRTRPGIARDAKGAPSPIRAIMTTLIARRRDTGGRGYIQLRSFGPEARSLRTWNSALSQAACINPASMNDRRRGSTRPVCGVGLGDKITMPDGLWPVVGIFRTNDDLAQSSTCG